MSVWGPGCMHRVVLLVYWIAAHHCDRLRMYVGAWSLCCRSCKCFYGYHKSTIVSASCRLSLHFAVRGIKQAPVSWPGAFLYRMNCPSTRVQLVCASVLCNCKMGFTSWAPPAVLWTTEVLTLVYVPGPVVNPVVTDTCVLT